MSWITAVWAALIGGCVAMALPHLLIWIWQRRPAYLFFVIASAGVIWIAACELAIMRSHSIDQVETALRWVQVGVFLLIVGLVGFVHYYLGTGHLWLGLASCGVRFVCLIVNFAFPPNLNFREITSLQPVHFLGEVVSVPVGVVSPWTRLGELASLLLLMFVIDTAVRGWRRQSRDARRHGMLVCVSIVVFILVAAGTTTLTHLQILHAPYLVSVPFAAILVAMAFELGSDLLRAGQIAEKLKTSEASLYESEVRFRTIADAAPVLMWMAGPDKLCTFFNQAWLEFTGRSMDQEFGNGWAEGVHLDDLTNCLSTYATAFDAREPFLLEYRLRRHDGEYRWVTDHGVPRYDAAGGFLGYIGACVDTTELRAKEKALREFEQRVTLAAEAAHLGVWERDLANNNFWISDRTRELFQFDPSEPVTCKKFRERAHPEDLILSDLARDKAIENKGGYELEYRVLLPDGTVRWIAGRARCILDENGNVARLLGVVMDVTDRKQAQQLFQLANDASPNATLLVNSKGEIIFVNAQTEKLFGYWREELMGKPIEILSPERFLPELAVRNQFLTQPEAKAFGSEAHLSGRRKDGSEFPVEVDVNPARTPQGTLILVNVTDISERKLVEEEARKRRDEIGRLSRISLLGEMTASIAHEVNQPLSGIISNASAGQRFIDRGNVDLAQLREILGDIDADAQRAHQVIRNVRNTIKKGATLRERVNMNDIITHVVHIVQPDAWSSSCKVRTSLAKDLPAIEADPLQIQQVLINLVGNAFQAMRDVPPDERKVEIATHRNGNDTVSVSVRDRGPGISGDAPERLFQQFFTTKEDGLGMGLAIVRSIIEAHQGTISANNAEGGGAEFCFVLPAARK